MHSGSSLGSGTASGPFDLGPSKFSSTADPQA
jgi:hypothetical protein